MNLRGKCTVSMSKTPLEWANLRSAGQIPCLVCYMREGGMNGGKGGWGEETACICICGRGSEHWAVFSHVCQQSTFHSVSFHSIGLKPPHSTWRQLVV